MRESKVIVKKILEIYTQKEGDYNDKKCMQIRKAKYGKGWGLPTLSLALLRFMQIPVFAVSEETEVSCTYE